MKCSRKLVAAAAALFALALVATHAQAKT